MGIISLSTLFLALNNATIASHVHGGPQTTFFRHYVPHTTLGEQ